jgi:hypothetical protein
MSNSIIASGMVSFSPFGYNPPTPKVWILEVGCRHEGGSVHGVFSNEADGIAAAIDYMEKDIARDVEIYMDGECTEEGPTITGFAYEECEDGNHLWNECFIWSYRDSDGKLCFSSGGFEYVSLKWYELQ